ncbi:MAG: hypothetical protein ACJA2E_002244 [Arenicella sp.]|jgi:hypothetical protein
MELGSHYEILEAQGTFAKFAMEKYCTGEILGQEILGQALYKKN